jgi:seryl-tRNA synthetase
MIDLNTIRKETEEFQKAVKRKGIEIDAQEILELDNKKKEFLQKVENLRHVQNEANQKIAKADGNEKSKLIAEMKQVASELKNYEAKLNEIQHQLTAELIQVPNPPHESVPDGGEEDAVELRKVGIIRNFEFHPKDHAEIGIACDLIDTKRSAKVSGSRFYYLKNEAVILELALAQYALEILIKKDFTPMATPTLVREKAMEATGFFPNEKVNIYSVNPTTKDNPEGDDLFLVGTSEVPLTMFHADEILENSELPKRYVGWSTCYRREAGTYGKDTKGIFRVHQFDKLEMFSFCDPAKSWEEHDFLVSCQEEILQGLGLPYRAVNIAAGDLGAPAAKKIDLEVWIPSEKRYRELTSCSNCTDFQARRANIRFREEVGTSFVHTLNGTAVAMTRMLIAIFENYQLKDGGFEVPEALRKWTGKNVICDK